VVELTVMKIVEHGSSFHDEGDDDKFETASSV
jgi:hypothetical protein